MDPLTPVRYASAGGVSIAYRVMGEGPLDVVWVPGGASNLDIDFESPSYVRLMQRLDSFSRLMIFDKRGMGLSDRNVGAATLEERMDDVRAVMDAVGSEQAALIGDSEGGPLSVLFAATYPQRTVAIVLYATTARVRRETGGVIRRQLLTPSPWCYGWTERPPHSSGATSRIVCVNCQRWPAGSSSVHSRSPY